MSAIVWTVGGAERGNDAENLGDSRLYILRVCLCGDYWHEQQIAALEMVFEIGQVYLL